MARVCAICRQGVRDGQSNTPVRAPAGCNDPNYLNQLRCQSLEVGGLYHACNDCVAILKPLIVDQWNAGRPYTPGMDVPAGFVFVSGDKDKKKDPAPRIVPLLQFTVETLPGNYLA